MHCPTTTGPSKKLCHHRRCSCGTTNAASAAEPAKTAPISESAGTPASTGSPDNANGHGGASEQRKGGAADCDTSCQARGGGNGAVGGKRNGGGEGRGQGQVAPRANVFVTHSVAAQGAVWCECGVLVRCLYSGLVVTRQLHNTTV